MYYLGGVFLPSIVDTKTQGERFDAIKINFPETFATVPDNYIKDCLARLGQIYLSEFCVRINFPGMIVDFMGVLASLMEISELMMEYRMFPEDAEPALSD